MGIKKTFKLVEIDRETAIWLYHNGKVVDCAVVHKVKRQPLWKFSSQIFKSREDGIEYAIEWLKKNGGKGL